MMQAKLRNSRAIFPPGMADIPSAVFVFDEHLMSIAKLEIVQQKVRVRVATENGTVGFRKQLAQQCT